MPDTVEGSLTGTAHMAIDVDLVRSEAWPSLEWTKITRHGRGMRYHYRISVKDAESLLDTLEYRGHGQGGEGFDDPPHWGSACRAAAQTLRATLAARVFG